MKTQPNFGPLYPTFGSVMEGRSFVGDTGGWYRFGFGGQEKDDEISGKGNLYSAEFWEYDARVGRRWNVDPLSNKFPWQSPYAAFDNNPILIKDPKGLAGEISNGQDVGNPEKKMERQNKRYQRLVNRLTKKYGAGTDQFNSELARLGSRSRYGSKIKVRDDHESPSVNKGNSGKTNLKFQIEYDNSKATHQQQSIYGLTSRGEPPSYPDPGDVGGETSFDVKVTDGQLIFLKAETLSGYQVQVLANGTPLTTFLPSPQPPFDPLNPQSATHIRATEYKSIAVNTGSSSPQLITITFKTIFTEVGAQVHYLSYPIRYNTAKVSVGTLKP